MEETKRIKKKKKHTIIVENTTAGEKYKEKWKRNYGLLNADQKEETRIVICHYSNKVSQRMAF